MQPMHHLLSMKLSIYDEPSDACDQVALVLDQVEGMPPLDPATKRGAAQAELKYNMLLNAYTKLDAELTALLEMTGERPALRQRKCQWGLAFASKTLRGFEKGTTEMYVSFLVF